MTGAGPCPLCGGGERLKVATQSLLDPVTRGAELTSRAVSYLVCATCQTVSMHPLPDQTTLDGYYAGPPLETGGPGQASTMASLVAGRLDLLRRVTGLRAGRALEVGAGPGRLLDGLRDEMGLSVLGLEPSDGFPARDDIRRETLDSFDPATTDWPAANQLVVCCHVLEHAADVAAFLDRLCSHVAAGGWLLLEVPSGERLASGLPSPYGQNISPLHLHHFTGAGLTAELRRRGLTVVFMSDHATGAYPALSLVARRDTADGPARRFIAQLTGQQAAAHLAAATLHELAATAGPVLVWGAGVDLFEVLELMPEGLPAGVDVFDRNPDKQGRALVGVPILEEVTVKGRAYSTVLAGVRHPVLAAAILAEAADWFPAADKTTLFPSHDWSET